MKRIKLDIKAKFGVVIAVVLAAVAVAGWAGLRTINKLDTNVTPQQVQLWVDMMEKQDMLRNFKSPDALFPK